MGRIRSPLVDGDQIFREVRRPGVSGPPPEAGPEVRLKHHLNQFHFQNSARHRDMHTSVFVWT